MTEKGCPDFISFDHDLGINEHGELNMTGYDIAKWIVEMDLEHIGWIPDGFKFQVHSANPIGKKNIESLFINYFKHRND